MRKRKPLTPIPAAKIRSALRRLWLYSNERREALRRAKIGTGLYLCSRCTKMHKAGNVQVDHITPVGKFINWDAYVNSLFCEIGNLRVLCKDCHLSVTNPRIDA